MPETPLRRRLLEGAVHDNLRTAEERAAEHAEKARRNGSIEPPQATKKTATIAVLAGVFVLLAAGLLWTLTRHRVEPVSVTASTPRADSEATSSPGRDRPGDQRTPPVFSQTHRVPTNVLPLAVHHVVIDPGHGGDDRGTATGDHRGAMAEKDITLDIAERLEPMLQAAGFDVTMTRRSDRTLTLRERAELANRLSADLFVSIHVNWFGARSVRGVETYYLGTTDDPDLNAFARRENRDSGYALADMRRLLEGIYADARQESSSRLAAQIQQSLHRSLLPTTPELQDRGVKTAPFVVLVATEMPAVLAEVSCLSNLEEAERLARPRYREHLATALLHGIQAYAHEVNQTEEQGS